MRPTEIAISVSDFATVVAVREDGEVVEVWIESAENRRLTGDIYLGVVRTVRAGMGAAFVDIGLERAGFLPMWHPEQPLRLDEVPASPRPATPKVGDEIMVQVSREPVGSKGPRLSTTVGLPGRYAVLLPLESSVGVSRRIGDEAERERLRALGADLTPPGMGLIVRTMAFGVERDLLAADVARLAAQWIELQQRRRASRAPALLYRSEGAALSAVRDLFDSHVQSLVVDDPVLFDTIVRGAAAEATGLAARVHLHEGEPPLLAHLGIDAVLDHLCDRVVRLPSGGSVVIEQTEAMVTIDVNTGIYAGGADQEDTIFLTNLEAAEEIARQLRLRDLGGIIAVDFIDMSRADHKRAVEERLVASLARDRAHTMVLPVSDLGVVELSRQRCRPSAAAMQTSCPACCGTGRVFSLAFAAWRLTQRWAALRDAGELGTVALDVAPELDQYLHLQEGERWKRMKSECAAVTIRADIELRRGGFRIGSALDRQEGTVQT